jgi:tetratricopeptide (TPR) repeat protein
MRVKPIGLLFAASVLIINFIIGDYDRADSSLRSFYSQVLSANFQGARKSIDEAIKLWPGNSRYYTWRAYSISQKLPAQCSRGTQSGVALSNENREAVSEAVADYRRALELNSRDAVAHHNLAWLEHLLGDDTTARWDWHEATAIDPDNSVFRLSFGMFLEENGDVQGAAEQYEIAIELSPSILDSQFFVQYRGRSPKAADSVVAHSIAKFESRLEQSNDPILEARLGKLYEFHNLTRSAQLLQDSAQQLPNLPLVWFNLGEIREMQGDPASAADFYAKASAIDSSLAGPFLGMGEIYFKNGQKSVSAYNMREAIKKWERINPITAAHNNRLYPGPPQRIDDLLPTTLLWYISPCEASRAYKTLANLSALNDRSRYLEGANTCEQIPAPHVFLRGNL